MNSSGMYCDKGGAWLPTGASPVAKEPPLGACDRMWTAFDLGRLLCCWFVVRPRLENWWNLIMRVGRNSNIGRLLSSKLSFTDRLRCQLICRRCAHSEYEIWYAEVRRTKQPSAYSQTKGHSISDNVTSPCWHHSIVEEHCSGMWRVTDQW
jgi:hypothetical protein